jgi:hypothetical protein
MLLTLRGLCAAAAWAVLAAGARPTSGQGTKPPATSPPAPGKPAPAAPAKVDPSEEFFSRGQIPHLRLRLTKEAEQSLRAEPRKYVECTLIEDGMVPYEGTRVKLKGAAGSFRPLDSLPAFTLNMGKGKPEFHGLDKFHLNNSVQDESYLSEWLSSQLCREAGLPAARATHARVWLNDRDLGFYVLKEGFNEDFLRRHFPAALGKGNLYDGGFLQDIDAGLERDEGEGPDDKADLKALLAACREGDATRRGALIAERLDVDAFLNFVALELMMCHWDGYAQNKNNYRLYFRGDTKKAVFFPHGMDQMFGDPNYSVFHVPGTIVSSAVLQNPAWVAKYRQRVRELLPLFAPDKLHAKLDAGLQRIRPVLVAMDKNRAQYVEDRVRDFKNRVNDRQRNIRGQLPPEAIVFGKQAWVRIDGWEPNPEGDAKLEKKDVGGRLLLVIETGPSKNCVASFRTKVRLAKGNYLLEAKVRPVNVKGLSDGKGAGAGVRVASADRQNVNKAVGTGDWQTVAYPFQVTEASGDVELVAELRSTAGGAIFDASSIRLVRLK